MFADKIEEGKEKKKKEKKERKNYSTFQYSSEQTYTL